MKPKKKLRGAALFHDVGSTETLVRSRKGSPIGIVTMRRGKEPITVKAFGFNERNPNRVELLALGRTPHKAAAWYYKDSPQTFRLGDGKHWIEWDEAYVPYLIRAMVEELKKRGVI